MSYGKRLEEAIDLAQSSRQKLAASIKVSLQAIGDVINGKTKAFTAENNSRAARFLRVDTDWLATGDGDPRPRSGTHKAPESIRDALRLEHELLNSLSGIERSQVINALTYFLQHPDEWLSIAEQVEASIAKGSLPAHTETGLRENGQTKTGTR